MLVNTVGPHWMEESSMSFLLFFELSLSFYLQMDPVPPTLTGHSPWNERRGPSSNL